METKYNGTEEMVLAIVLFMFLCSLVSATSAAFNSFFEQTVLPYIHQEHDHRDHHDHHQVNQLMDQVISKVMPTIGENVADFDSCKCPSVK